FGRHLRSQLCSARGRLEKCLREQCLCRATGTRLDPAKGRLERGCAPQMAAFGIGNIPRRKAAVVAAVADGAADPRNADAPHPRLNLLDTVVHIPSPEIPTSLRWRCC